MSLYDPQTGQTFNATLTGAKLTGTILVPSNHTVTATSSAGAVVTWPKPASIPGATPGSCSPPSGSTFPLFKTTVTCQVTDYSGNVATGTFQVNVQTTTQYFTRILSPSNGTAFAGNQHPDAGASDKPGVTKVEFHLTGGSINDKVIAMANPTYYGWIASWDTTTVPDGTYTLQSVAYDSEGNVSRSVGVTVKVENTPPTTRVLKPSNNATLTGNPTLDAAASDKVGVTKVEFHLTGGTLNDALIATATPTYYGWIVGWDTTTVPDGTYTLQSVAYDAAGHSTHSAGVTITVAN